MKIRCLVYDTACERVKEIVLFARTYIQIKTGQKQMARIPEQGPRHVVAVVSNLVTTMNSNQGPTYFHRKDTKRSMTLQYNYIRKYNIEFSSNLAFLFGTSSSYLSIYRSIKQANVPKKSKQQ